MHQTDVVIYYQKRHVHCIALHYRKVQELAHGLHILYSTVGTVA
jgi:hypothetical protein